MPNYTYKSGHATIWSINKRPNQMQQSPSTMEEVARFSLYITLHSKRTLFKVNYLLSFQPRKVALNPLNDPLNNNNRQTSKNVTSSELMPRNST